ncbi:hypothetical protein [Carboxylicivirga sp. N1Y90]|uniref:hypothetical protein n=1 Tax=Carboxylicivirga fragile TaxID=3417571 RepID=UPI003D34F984|nr:hypothetical protein [Marinilabiliaceae bacterium N1Y90]
MDKTLMLKKMNIRIQRELYDLIKLHAELEHLPPSTFVRKFLMDNLIQDSRSNKRENTMPNNGNY